MHMGHSHSHSHHHSHSHSSPQRPVPKGWRGKLLLFSSRRTVRVLFAFLVTLLPPILKGRSLMGISKTDVGAFLLTSGILALGDRIRNEVQVLLSKGNLWRSNMLKHSAPLSTDYLFRNDNAADRVTFVGVIVNLLLSAGKFAAGAACHSSALIADAGHSLSDLFSDFVTLWAVQVARLPPDDDHPYGHGKFESVGSLFLSLTLLATGLSVGASSYVKLLRVVTMQRVRGTAAAAPTWPALIVAGASIASKEWLYRITRKVGEQCNSQVVIANAWHHRSDAYSSVLALVSIGLAMTIPTFLAADPFAGMLVAGMISLTGAEILGESVKQLTDAVPDEDLVRRAGAAAAANDPDVHAVSRVRARQVGPSALVDVDLRVAPDLSASAVRAVEERARARIVATTRGVLHAEVRATMEGGAICPLISAVVEGPGAERHVSAAGVEGEARERLAAHPEVRSVEGVTVHYQDTVHVRVDANICVDPHLTVSDANRLAATLRKSLQQLKDIDRANIFLDLNAEAAESVQEYLRLAP